MLNNMFDDDDIGNLTSHREIYLALLIFAQIFSDHFSSAASFASIYSSSECQHHQTYY
jgi:hypothetical protein